jgi:ABC-2 type transport system permease protein
MGLSAILAIAYRDLLKFLRDPVRIVSALIFPAVFIGILGGSFQANLGDEAGFNYLIFTFTGVLAQTLFQSSAIGLVSLIEDRENDFSQEIFVSPVSRYKIVFGKISGESLVSIAQGVAIVALGVILGVPISGPQLLGLTVVSVIVCLFGGAFGVLILANLSSQRAANQIFPFIMLPQFFLAGVFTPIEILPWYLDILSKISPMRYAVDLTRGVFYTGQPDYAEVVLQGVPFNMLVITVMFTIFLIAGTWLFVRGERNR